MSMLIMTYLAGLRSRLRAFNFREVEHLKERMFSAEILCSFFFSNGTFLNSVVVVDMGMRENKSLVSLRSTLCILITDLSLHWPIKSSLGPTFAPRTSGRKPSLGPFTFCDVFSITKYSEYCLNYSGLTSSSLSSQRFVLPCQNGQ